MRCGIHHTVQHWKMHSKSSTKWHSLFCQDFVTQVEFGKTAILSPVNFLSLLSMFLICNCRCCKLVVLTIFEFVFLGTLREQTDFILWNTVCKNEAGTPWFIFEVSLCVYVIFYHKNIFAQLERHGGINCNNLSNHC